MRVIEWLPSRLMVLSFSVFGDFDKTRGHVLDKGTSLQPSTDEFFEDAIDAALDESQASSVYERASGLFRLLDRSFYSGWVFLRYLFSSDRGRRVLARYVEMLRHLLTASDVRVIFWRVVCADIE